MAKTKTSETSESVMGFIKKVPDLQKQKDSWVLIDLMKKISGHSPKMWGPSIIGFGKYHYVYESGHEGDAPLLGFSPRKAAIVVYIESEFDKRDELLQKIGKHTVSKVCVYIKRLSDIDIKILEKLLVKSLQLTKSKYP